MFDVVALGELLIDFTPNGKDENNNPILTAIPGGAPANFLASLAKFNKKTAFIGKVGDDMFGKLLSDTVEKAGIDISGIIKDKNYFTTLAFVSLSENGERSFSFARKPGADMMLSFEDIPENLLKETKIFHFGTLSMTGEPSKSATEKAVLKAKENGALISFDPNYRAPLWENVEDAKERMLWGLNHADIIKISDEEAEMLGCKSYEAFAKDLLSKNAKLIFVTCGKDGCYFFNKNASGFVPAFKVDTIDTNGAGDIFGGSALSKVLEFEKNPDLLNENELKETVIFACASAALSTTKHGAIPSIPNFDEISFLVATNSTET